MKSNLDSFFKTDKSLETNGVWLEFGDAGFLVKRFGGFNSKEVQLAMSKHYKPFARQADLGTLDVEVQQEIMVKVFVESALADWRGVEIDGKKTPFSKEEAIKLFTELPDLFNEIQKQATAKDNYKVDLGNS